jgi:hypothetical protein
MHNVRHELIVESSPMLNPRITRLPKTRRGAVTVLVATSLTLLLGILALTVESGRLYDLQRREQSACDAAALAAATEMYRAMVDSEEPRKLQDPETVAYEIARLNGFPSSAPHQVTVSTPPRTGTFAGRDGFVQVEIESRLKRSFSGVFGSNDLTVHTSSVAGGTQLATKASLLVLEPKKKDALKIKGSSSSLMTQGDVFVNSSSKSAVKLDKKSQLTAEAVMVVGGMDKKSKGLLDGDLQTGVEATPDPYASLTPPPKGSAIDPKHFLTVENGRNVYRLPPGTYKELKFEHDDLVYLQSGVFYVEEEIDIKGDASVVARGVTIYSAGKKNLKFNTRGSVDLTPPSTGPYAGISLYVDRASKKKIEFKKDATYTLSGVIYAPNSEVKFKHTQAILSGADDSDDADDDTDYGGPETTGSLNASLVVKKLSIDKHSEVQLLGSDIDAQRPFLGVIE